MKHLNLSDSWEFGIEPFAAYRCNLVYGRNKRDREFLPVKDIEPVTQYEVTAYAEGVLYSGTNKAEAEATQNKYDAEQKAIRKEGELFPKTASLKAGSAILPEGKFRVIKTRDKGTILVVPGEDTTNRCLLFVGCEGGFRGGEQLLEDDTTATILKKCSAGNNCSSSTEVIAILEIGQSVAFYTYGRRTSEVYTYTWDGTEIKKQHFSKAEWDERNALKDADGEVL